jgi:hypothetical protein
MEGVSNFIKYNCRALAEHFSTVFPSSSPVYFFLSTFEGKNMYRR